jgi:hypothetical protein
LSGVVPSTGIWPAWTARLSIATPLARKAGDCNRRQTPSRRHGTWPPVQLRPASCVTRSTTGVVSHRLAARKLAQAATAECIVSRLHGSVPGGRDNDGQTSCSSVSATDLLEVRRGAGAGAGDGGDECSLQLPGVGGDARLSPPCTTTEPVPRALPSVASRSLCHGSAEPAAPDRTIVALSKKILFARRSSGLAQPDEPSPSQTSQTSRGRAQHLTSAVVTHLTTSNSPAVSTPVLSRTPRRLHLAAPVSLHRPAACCYGVANIAARPVSTSHPIRRAVIRPAPFSKLPTSHTLLHGHSTHTILKLSAIICPDHRRSTHQPSTSLTLTVRAGSAAYAARSRCSPLRFAPTRRAASYLEL